jgi:hypothetical protein
MDGTATPDLFARDGHPLTLSSFGPPPSPGLGSKPPGDSSSAASEDTGAGSLPPPPLLSKPAHRIDAEAEGT